MMDLLCRQIDGYAQGGVLNALMFLVGAHYRIGKTNAAVFLNRKGAVYSAGAGQSQRVVVWDVGSGAQLPVMEG